MLGLGSALALASVAPFRPGDPLFNSLQRPVEQAVVNLDPRPSGRAYRLLDLARRRADDLSLLAGSEREASALSELEQTLMQAVQAVAAARQADAPGLRPQLVLLLQMVEKTLPRVKLASTQDPQQWANFQVWENGIARMAVHPDLILASLAADPQGQPVLDSGGTLPTPTAGPTPTLSLVASRNVWFPPGSPGALHEFYPLTGAHASLECEACHPLGEYAGTPALCVRCHDTSTPLDHFPGDCEVCHTTTAWIPASYDHSVLRAANCQECHLKDMPVKHYPGQCSACHTTTAWKPANFNHVVAGATDCLSCHARPAGHYNGQCSACHTTSAWKPAHFNHEVAGATDCQSCHQRPSSHYNGQCSACHSTGAWKPAHFNHAAAGATACQSCHARPGNHFSGQCSQCHSTSTWSGASFNHEFDMNHGGANGDCGTCHPGGYDSHTCTACHEGGVEGGDPGGGEDNPPPEGGED
jgi:hypothetical protein